uniref:Uncharacterized protein n=1 Tax=Aegilops tauschii subsp. strangulata TaxID=200361 RepID=A0A453JKU7_AEGTS
DLGRSTHGDCYSGDPDPATQQLLRRGRCNSDSVVKPSLVVLFSLKKERMPYYFHPLHNFPHTLTPQPICPLTK